MTRLQPDDRKKIEQIVKLIDGLTPVERDELVESMKIHWLRSELQTAVDQADKGNLLDGEVVLAKLRKRAEERLKDSQETMTDALDILDRRYYGGAKRRIELEATRLNAEAARLVYEMRTEAKLSQQELATLVGTTQSVISRLEDNDYSRLSLTMLRRIAAALDKRLVLTAIPI